MAFGCCGWSMAEAEVAREQDVELAGLEVDIAQDMGAGLMACGPPPALQKGDGAEVACWVLLGADCEHTGYVEVVTGGLCCGEAMGGLVGGGEKGS